MHVPPTPRVLVVGAGCAGLSATYTLKKLGIDALCLEARDVAGGRCRTLHEDGYAFSIGAGSTEPQWRTTFEYLSELGLRDRVFSLRKQRYGFWRDGRVRTVCVGGGLWDSVKALPENLRFLVSGLPWRTWPQLVRLGLALRRFGKLVDTENHDFSKLAEISETSTEEFVLRHGGPEALEHLFHPFLATMVLARPRDVSVAHPISLFSLMRGMCSLEGGMGIITSTLYERVKERVRLGTPVRRVVLRDGRAVGVETEQGFLPADHVICALDAVATREVIPELPATIREPLETCRYSSTWYYQFGIERHFLPDDADFHVLMLPASAPTLLSFVAKGSRPGEKAVMIAATRGWEDARLSAMGEAERRRAVIDDVRRFLPQFPAEPLHTRLFRWDRAVNLESPGQFNAIQRLLRDHLDDVPGLHLAGEYLFLIACTEGALATGQAAAHKVATAMQDESRVSSGAAASA